MKPTQSTEPNPATKGRDQKEELWPYSLGKVDPRYSKLEKNELRQRNTLHMKEKGKNSEDQINKEEIGKLSEKEFRVTIVKMIQNLKNRMEKIWIN